MIFDINDETSCSESVFQLPLAPFSIFMYSSA